MITNAGVRGILARVALSVCKSSSERGDVISRLNNGKFYFKCFNARSIPVMYESDKFSRCRESEMKFGGKLVRLGDKRVR